MQKKKRRGVSIGIDFGTYFSSAAVYQDGEELFKSYQQGNILMPSCVAFRDDEILIGEQALKQAYKNLNNTIYNFKDLIGRKYEDPITQMQIKKLSYRVQCGTDGFAIIAVTHKNRIKKYYPHQILAMIISKLKEQTEQSIGLKIQKAVLSVPSYFNISQIQSFKDAAKITGFIQPRIINATSAISLLLAKKKELKKYLILDIGSRVDISMVLIDDGAIEVKSYGNAEFGGQMLSDKLEQYCATQFQKRYSIDLRENSRSMKRLRIAVEKAKQDLSFASTAYIQVDNIIQNIDFQIKITKEFFQSFCEQQFNQLILAVERIFENFVDSEFTKENFDQIILVGGCSKIPKISTILKKHFKRDIKITMNVGKIANGASLMADFIQGNQNLNHILLMQILTHSLAFQDSTGNINIMINKNTSIPTRKSKKLQIQAHVSSFAIKIYEIDQKTGRNLYLEEVILHNLTHSANRKPQLQIIFENDEVNTITVSVKEIGTLNNSILQIFKNQRNKKVQQLMYQQQISQKNQLEVYLLQIRQNVQELLSANYEWLHKSEATPNQYQLRLKLLRTLFDPFMVNVKKLKYDEN